MKDGLTVGMSGRDMFLFDPKMCSNEVSFSVSFIENDFESSIIRLIAL